MEDIQYLFREHANHFTIYVVEQKFVVGRGLDFFKKYKGTPNYIDSDQMARTLLTKIFSWINKKIPSLGELVNITFKDMNNVNLVELIVAFSKLFGTHEHQAAGPNALDPIIIQEGRVLKKYVDQIVTLHRNSFLSPAIIILLRDNDFERAKKMLAECPNGIFIKFIRNSGKTELHKVINTGAANIEGFINSFAQQCFSTCSNTPHEVLLNKEWARDSVVKKYVPRILKYRANLICDEKNEIITNLSDCILDLKNDLNTKGFSDRDIVLLKNFLGISKIFRVFCNDYGGYDIGDALSLSKELNNEILQAYVYKYAFFFRDKDINEQNDMLKEAYNIFMRNEMVDNAIYCKNNFLVRQFDTSHICAKEFADMVGEATGDIPGLVGMAHLYNNAGMAYMMTAQPDLAMEYFDKGLEYANRTERFVQKIAIKCNKLITKSYYSEEVEYSEINKLLIQIFDGMVENEKLPFISARYVMNLLLIALRQNQDWAKELLHKYNIVNLINTGISNNAIGSGQLLMQIDYIEQKLPELNFKSQCIVPADIINVTGKRKDFIQKTGLNPFYFFTWL